jgi:hypothetical protein
MVIEVEGESEAGPSPVQFPPSDGLAEAVALGAEAESDQEAEGAGTSDPLSPSLPLSLPAPEVADGCSPLTEADAA